MTLKDIAKEAGVSISTVSRIINGNSSNAASKEMQDKIWSIDELQNKQSGHVIVYPYHAWFEGTLPNKVNKLSTVDGSNTTDISSIIDSLNSPNVRYYDLNGHCLSEPQKGINIMRMADGTSKKILIK